MYSKRPKPIRILFLNPPEAFVTVSMFNGKFSINLFDKKAALYLRNMVPI